MNKKYEYSLLFASFGKFPPFPSPGPSIPNEPPILDQHYEASTLLATLIDLEARPNSRCFKDLGIEGKTSEEVKK